MRVGPHAPTSSGLRWMAVAAALLVMLPTQLVAPGAAGAPTLARRVVTGWLPSWDTSAALAAVERNQDLLTEASPFWFTARASKDSVTVSAAPSSATMAGVVGRLRAAGIAVIPSVTDGSSARAMAGVLATRSTRRAHVAQLAALVSDLGFDGIELDYEKFAFSDGRSTWAATRPNWVAFVSELGAALHARGKRLALAVPPIYDGARSSTSGYWVYDYQGVSKAVDSLRIMTYDYSVSRPGPISPLSFVRRSLSYAVTAFPRERLRMGLPAYGRLWIARRSDGTRRITGTCPASGVPGTTSFTNTRALSYLTAMAGGTAPTIRHDDTTGEAVATFQRTYTGKAPDGTGTSCTVDHVAWWVDARGVSARMDLVGEYRIAGAAIWHLSGVDDASWTALHAYAASVAPAATTVTVQAPAKVVSGRAVTVRASVVSAAGVPAGTRATLYRRTVGTATWRRVAAARTDRGGVVRFAVGALARSSRWRVSVGATWDRAAGAGAAGTSVSAGVVASVSTRTPRPGANVTVRVTVSPHRRGMVARRQMLVSGSWRTMDTARTAADGTVAFRIEWPRTPTRNTYRITTNGTTSLLAGRSARFTIGTR